MIENSKNKKDRFDRNKSGKKTKSKCSISSRCGGCQYVDIAYTDQLIRKQKYISELLKDYGNVDKIVGMDNPYYYRNKVTAVFKHKKGNEIIAGVYEEGTHNVLPVTKCFIENETASSIIQVVIKLVKSFKITVYNENSGYGILRYVMVRTAHRTGEVMVVLVTSTPIFPSKKNFAKALIKECPEITTVIHNINEKDTSMVLGERSQSIYGKGYIEDILCGKRFRISPTSFYQINPVQTEKLYWKAMEYAGLNDRKGKTKTVIDAYCGIGTIGIIASKYCANVIGVELNRDAIRDAKSNARINEVTNVSFYNNDAGDFMLDMKEKDEKADIVFMDPPRSGSSEKFISSLLGLEPDRIVYISCGPESLVRDLKIMTKGKQYKVERIGCFDLFPLTSHVETVVALHRTNS